jgi:hypothetical protein
MQFGMNRGLQHKHYTSVLKKLHPSPYSGGNPVLNLILSAIKKANSKA